MRVDIFYTKNDAKWWLRMAMPNQVLFLQSYRKLLDAYSAAWLLRVHVDNAEDLPIPQYAEIRESRALSSTEEQTREARASRLWQALHMEAK